MADPIDPGNELKDPAAIDAINDLDTARMTLRWAMERLRGLEQSHQEASAKADWELKMRLKVEEDFRRQLELEGTHFASADRERRAKVEELAQALEKAKAEGAENARRVQEAYEKKFLELEEIEKARLRELAAKEADFDHFCSQQKNRAEIERRQIRAEAAREAEERFKTLQRLTDERMNALSAAWARERDGLLKDLASWRERAEGAQERRLELEQRSRTEDDLSRRSTRLTGEREDEYQRLSKTWEAQRVLLEGQLRHFEEQASRFEAKAAEAEKGRKLMEDAARQAGRAAEDRQAESLKMVESWNRQRATLEEQIRQWQARAAEAVQIDRARELGAERRREQLAAKAQEQVRELEGRLRTRDAEVEALLKTLEEYRTRLGAAEERAGRWSAGTEDLNRKLELERASGARAFQEARQAADARIAALERALKERKAGRPSHVPGGRKQ